MKLFKKLLSIIAIVLFILVLILTMNAYSMYKTAINEISLKDKILSLEKDSNYAYYKDLPEDYINAVIAIEDHRFKEHHGIDYISLGRAVIRNISEFDFVEGGSTITQQVAKNLYFSQKKKITRKVAELFVVYNLEKDYDKEKILELYVNTNYFGSGYYGVKEAAKGYFDKSLDELDFNECTLLAGIPNAPSVYSLDANPDLAKKRATQVVSAMEEYGYI